MILAVSFLYLQFEAVQQYVLVAVVFSADAEKENQRTSGYCVSLWWKLPSRLLRVFLYIMVSSQ